MKKFFLVLGLCLLGLNFSPSAQASNFTISIGGMPGMMLVDNCGGCRYSTYSMPYYGSGFYFSTGHRYYGHGGPRHHHHDRPHHGGGHHSSHHGPHHGGHR